VDVNNQQLQDMRNAATKQDAEATKSKADCNALRTAITDIRDKINDLEAKVGRPQLSPVYISHAAMLRDSPGILVCPVSLSR